MGGKLELGDLGAVFGGCRPEDAALLAENRLEGLKGLGPFARGDGHPVDGAARPFKGALTTHVTQMLIRIATPSFLQTLDQDDRAKITCDLEMLALALACFHQEQGRWPGELKDLCPGLLKAIPADRFSDKPLIYRPNEDGYLLYSVGRNRRDDGGLREKRVGKKWINLRKDDIAVEVKPPDLVQKTSPTPEDKR